jgi:2-phosphoglycolate phosphatase
VLFDLDGTLLDSAPDPTFAANVVRSEKGVEPVGVDELRPWVSQGARGMITRGLGISTDHPDYELARQVFMEVYAKCLSLKTTWWPGMDGLAAALEEGGIPWGIVTNKISRFTEPLLRNIGLFERCAVVVSGDTTSHAKLHPAPIEYALAQLGLPAEAVVYVGDDLRDIQSGFAAGTWRVACGFGHHVEDPLPDKWGADLVIHLEEQLLTYI